jgi:hypothetical protein
MHDSINYLEEEAIPFPDALITSSRAIGYNMKTAIADIIDNSISAKAKNIEIQWRWQEKESWIAVVDDGDGMNLNELVAAMRLGSLDPVEERNPTDLGRFGLGLKTASFSQCKSLTVLSKKDGYAPVTRTWDLDLVRELKAWKLTSWTPDIPEFDEWRKLLEQRDSGTIILWTKLDRILGEKRAYREQDKVEFISNLSDAVDHLGLTFHKFIEQKGVQKVNLTINGTPITAFDPAINSAGSKRRLLEKRERNEGAVEIQGMTLPYFPTLSPEEHREWRSTSWYDMQGFYVYRGKRLLVAGDWLGMFRKAESSKHARVFIELQNTEDHNWKIDVKKSMAIPPSELAQTLRQAAQEARMASEMMYGKRKETYTSGLEGYEEIPPLWKLGSSQGGIITPELNSNHPLIQLNLEKPTKAKLNYLLKVIARELPMHQIIAANEKDPDKLLQHPRKEATQEDLDAAFSIARQFIEAGKPRAWAITHTVSFSFFEGIRTQVQVELEAKL